MSHTVSAQFSAARIETLRFDKALREPMAWVYQQWGDSVYEKGTLAENEKAILAWCEEQDISLNTKQRKNLLGLDTWQKHLTLVQTIGTAEFSDFNRFKKQVDKALKALAKEADTKLGESEKNKSSTLSASGLFEFALITWRPAF